MVADRAVGDQDDDQLYYTLIYLDLEKRVSPDSRKEELHVEGAVVSTPITLAAGEAGYSPGPQSSHLPESERCQGRGGAEVP